MKNLLRAGWGGVFFLLVLLLGAPLPASEIDPIMGTMRHSAVYLAALSTLLK